MRNEEIYEAIARKHGVTVESVKAEMQAAIDYAYENCNDEKMKEKQNQIPKKEEIPTTIEFIEYVKNMIDNQNNI